MKIRIKTTQNAYYAMQDIRMIVKVKTGFRCCVCLKWRYDTCTGVDPNDTNNFTGL